MSRCGVKASHLMSSLGDHAAPLPKLLNCFSFHPDSTDTRDLLRCANLIATCGYIRCLRMRRGAARERKKGGVHLAL